jgi:hypothetical protein
VVLFGGYRTEKSLTVLAENYICFCSKILIVAITSKGEIVVHWSILSYMGNLLQPIFSLPKNLILDLYCRAFVSFDSHLFYQSYCDYFNNA